MGCHDPRSLEFSNVNAKATTGPAKARLLTASIALIAALVVASGLPVADVRAAVDFVSNVGVQIVARPGFASGSEQDFELRNGGVLRSGDGVQVRLESDADAYVYVVAYGSSHTAILLHPFSAKAEDARVQRGQVKVIPETGVFLPLDGQEGREALFTIVSRVPLADITDLLDRIEAHGDDIGAITAMIGTTYPGVRHLTFKHIGARALVGVAATAPRAGSFGITLDSAADSRAGDAGAGQVGGATPSPTAGGWSVPSSGGFGTSKAAAGTATAAAGANADPTAGTEAAATGASVAPAASTSAVPAASVSAAKSEADAVPVSSALRKAREAAGIDESEFRGILASLPESSRAAVPAEAREPYEEQGVLSAEGSRIRPLGRVQLESDTGNRSQN